MQNLGPDWPEKQIVLYKGVFDNSLTFSYSIR